MTKREENGMLVCVLLLCASVANFAFGMGKSMVELRPCPTSEETTDE